HRSLSMCRAASPSRPNHHRRQHRTAHRESASARADQRPVYPGADVLHEQGEPAIVTDPPHHAEIQLTHRRTYARSRPGLISCGHASAAVHIYVCITRYLDHAVTVL